MINGDEYLPDGLIVLDLEAASLAGKAFAGAALVHWFADPNPGPVWTDRCISADVPDDWVRRNVLPHLDHPRGGIPTTLPDYRALLESWRAWYAPLRSRCALLVHCGFPVETRFLSDAAAVDGGFLADTAPHPVHDLADALWQAGHDPRSVDGYLSAHGIPIDGPVHHPVTDVRAILRAWLHLEQSHSTQMLRRWRNPLSAWIRQRRCPHHDQLSPKGGSWIYTASIVNGHRRLRVCRKCRHSWLI